MKINIEGVEHLNTDYLKDLHDYNELLKVIKVGEHFQLTECHINYWKTDKTIQRVYMNNDLITFDYCGRSKRLEVRLRQGYHSTNGYRQCFKFDHNSVTTISLTITKDFDKIIKDIQTRFFDKLQNEIRNLKEHIDSIRAEELEEIRLKNEIETLGFETSNNFRGRFYLNGSNNYLSIEYGKIKLTSERHHMYFGFKDAKTAIKANEILVKAIKSVEAMEA